MSPWLLVSTSDRKILNQTLINFLDDMLSDFELSKSKLDLPCLLFVNTANCLFFLILSIT